VLKDCEEPYFSFNGAKSCIKLKKGHIAGLVCLRANANRLGRGRRPQVRSAHDFSETSVATMVHGQP
jgi:hypothetical protein